jgi:hypothetical protein
MLLGNMRQITSIRRNHKKENIKKEIGCIFFIANKMAEVTAKTLISINRTFISWRIKK